MEQLQQSGVEMILWLQGFKTPALDMFFEFITQFGGLGYVLILPLLLWLIEPRLGLRALVAMLIAQYIVMLLKDVVQEPRPFLFDERVISNGEHGYSFPSGHAMGSMVFYGLVLFWTEKRWLKVLLAALIFFIGVSRSYLGVHYPHDVVTGWLLGLLFIMAWPLIEQGVFAKLEQSPPATQSLAVLFVPLLVAVAHYYVFDYFGALVLAGALSIGIYALLRDMRYPALAVQASLPLKIAAYVVGVALAFAVLLTFGKIYPAEGSTFYNVFVWLHGVLVVTVLVDVVPWALQKLQEKSQPLKPLDG